MVALFCVMPVPLHPPSASRRRRGQRARERITLQVEWRRWSRHWLDTDSREKRRRRIIPSVWAAREEASNFKCPPRIVTSHDQISSRLQVKGNGLGGRASGRSICQHQATSMQGEMRAKLESEAEEHRVDGTGWCMVVCGYITFRRLWGQGNEFAIEGTKHLSERAPITLYGTYTSGQERGVAARRLMLTTQFTPWIRGTFCEFDPNGDTTKLLSLVFICRIWKLDRSTEGISISLPVHIPCFLAWPARRGELWAMLCYIGRSTVDSVSFVSASLSLSLSLRVSLSQSLSLSPSL